MGQITYKECRELLNRLTTIIKENNILLTEGDKDTIKYLYRQLSPFETVPQL